MVHSRIWDSDTYDFLILVTANVGRMKDTSVIHTWRYSLPGPKPYKEEMQIVFD